MNLDYHSITSTLCHVLHINDKARDKQKIMSYNVSKLIYLIHRHFMLNDSDEIEFTLDGEFVRLESDDVIPTVSEIAMIFNEFDGIYKLKSYKEVDYDEFCKNHTDIVRGHFTFCKSIN